MSKDIIINRHIRRSSPQRSILSHISCTSPMHDENQTMNLLARRQHYHHRSGMALLLLMMTLCLAIHNHPASGFGIGHDGLKKQKLRLGLPIVCTNINYCCVSKNYLLCFNKVYLTFFTFYGLFVYNGTTIIMYIQSEKNISIFYSVSLYTSNSNEAVLGSKSARFFSSSSLLWLPCIPSRLTSHRDGLSCLRRTLGRGMRRQIRT